LPKISDSGTVSVMQRNGACYVAWLLCPLSTPST